MPNADLFQVPFAIIADDLAGACDCGIEFVDCSPEVRVHVSADVHGTTIDLSPGSATLVINTESRDMSPAAAVELVRSASRQVLDVGARIILKKSDSAFRGHYVEELTVAIEAIRPTVTVVCPAIPDYGRTTIGGVQRIGGRPIDEGFYVRDPKHPVVTSSVIDLLCNVAGVQVSHLSIDQLRREQVKQLPAHGVGARIVSVDGETNADMDRAAALFWPGGESSIVDADARVLFVGGQGIAAAIARRYPVASRSAGQDPVSAGGPVLIVSASLHPATRVQVSCLEETCDVHPVPLPENGYESAAVCDQVVAELLTHAETGGVAVLDTGGMHAAAPQAIETAVARICGTVLRRTTIGALFLTGGSTAHAVCRDLGIDRLVLRERVATGAVLARPLDPGMPHVCVKGGSLGEEDTLVRFVRRRRRP